MQLQPIVTKAANVLPTWKSKLLNKAARLTLIKSVLTAIPIHQLLAHTPTKKIIKLLERIERGFLLERRATANDGSYQVNWGTASRPLSHGGLGIQSIERAGLALRLRWLWYSKRDDGRAWIGLDLQLYLGEKPHPRFYLPASR